MNSGRESRRTLAILRLISFSLAIVVAIIFAGWSVVASRTSGIALVIVTAMIVLGTSTVKNFEESTHADKSSSSP